MEKLLRNALLESRVRRKLSCTVRRGEVGKAFRILYASAEYANRDGSLASYPTACPVRRRLRRVIRSRLLTFVRQ